MPTLYRPPEPLARIPEAGYVPEIRRNFAEVRYFIAIFTPIMSEQKKINIRNKRATFDYEILEEWVAGVVLVGTEIKSIRAGKASMIDSFCYFDKGEVWIRGVNIAEYAWGTCNNHSPRRDRKLLLTAREIDKLQRSAQDRGLTVVGLRLFLNDRGLAKVVIGLARGRKAYDKREYLKENDAKREMDKAMKNYGK